ncbi:MAG: PepSY-associated TM helix domain-containing protein, partial [Lysobacter sp.]|nr:PepSY-associated TM helix domain-containing protein [Lysobacter sp.]
YMPGNATAEVKQSRHSLLAGLNRLHKGVGGGWAWIALADSFAIGMLLLGLSGIWLWARGRSARQMVASVMGLSVLVLLVVLGPALL